MSITAFRVERGMTPAAADGVTGSVAFVGTATVLVRFADFTILTDPNFLHAGDHAHIGYGMTTRRLTEPALDIADLPAIDLVLLSHYHGDHFDQVVEARLDKALPIVTTEHASRALARKGFTNTRPLRTWQSCEFHKSGNDLNITAMPGRHGPGIINAALPPVMGEMLEFASAGGATLRVYVSGDTLLHPDLAEIPRRYPGIDLGLFHLGGTRVFGITVTMDARQGVQAVRLIDPHVAIPIHYDDYPVFKSPLSEFRAAADAAGINARIAYLDRGQHCVFSLAP
jgi:L-ascorbate metabolism protein UlaG (beta-lactamase superfamily)